MTVQEFEQLHGITMGPALRKIFKAKVHVNARTIPNKLTPEQFWEIAQANSKIIAKIIGDNA